MAGTPCSGMRSVEVTSRSWQVKELVGIGVLGYAVGELEELLLLAGIRLLPVCLRAELPPPCHLAPGPAAVSSPLAVQSALGGGGFRPPTSHLPGPAA